MTTQRPRLRVILLGIALAGSTMAGAVFIAQQLWFADHDRQLTGLIKWGNTPVPTLAWVDMVSQYDLAAFSWGAWDSPTMQTAMNDIRKKNLDIHLGTYFSAFTAPQWTKRDAERGGTGWGARWWNAMSPYLAHTTTGDTAAIFLNNYDFNVLLPEARAAAIGLLKEYVLTTRISWVMLDFISVPLPDLKVFQDPRWQQMEDGDLDFDGDGIGHWVDADEQAALKVAWYAYMREMRAALGNEVLLIPNGHLAMYDPAFSKLVDGCYVEGFPKWFYGSGDIQNFTNALDPAYGQQAVPNLCAPGRWHRTPGYVLLEDWNDNDNYGYIAALWDGCVELRRARNDLVYPPVPVDLTWLGAPTGPANGLTRVYEEGTVTVVPSGARITVTAQRGTK